MNQSPLSVLIIEDSEDDMLLLLSILKSNGYHPTYKWVDSAAGVREALDSQSWDVIICDYVMPGFSALAALAILQKKGQDIPFIILSGNVHEETAVTAMKAGAHDFILKSRMARLIPAIEREMREAQIRHKHRLAEEALLQSEARYRSLVSATTQAVWTTNASGEVVEDISSWRQLTGQTEAEVKGWGWLDALHPEDRQRTAQLWFDAVSTKLLYETEYRMQVADGTYRHFSVRGVPVFDESGEIKEWVGTSTDITEKKQLESQFLRAQRMESIGSLAGGIAHDLNNVLAPILMTVQLLQLKLPDEQSQRLLNTLETSAKRGAGLIKQVLSFARGLEGNASGKGYASHTTIKIQDTIAEIGQIVKETFPKSIEFYTDIAPDLWAISGETTQLHQVLMNLVVNARDAMPNGGSLKIFAENLYIDEHYARIDVDAGVGAYIAIAISDTGMGIPPEILERIFEPFFTTKEVGKGTGLGLSTVFSIIKSHGGFVNVYSEVGSTEFKVYLPAVQAQETQPAQDLDILTGTGQLILVVDDEAAINEITRASLENSNYSVLNASDGIEAIKVYAQHKDSISLVLMDMMMPMMDIKVVIATLEKINPEVKILAVSGLAANQQLAETAGASVKAFLAKPYTLRELLQAINEVLGQ